MIAAFLAAGGALYGCFSRAPLDLSDDIRTHPIRESTDAITNEGDEIRIDVYRPDIPGRHPAVVLLHGSGGIHEVGPQQVTRYARTLAALGQVAMVVHYFDGTGNFVADEDMEREHYWRWVTDIRAAITWADSQPYINSRRISLLGISLGAWLGVGVGAVDKRVRRLALIGAGLEPFLADSLSHAPPVLLLHGSDDEEVQPAKARQLLNAMHAAGRQARLVVYPGEGHTLGDSASADALLQATRFFDGRH